MIYFPCGTTDCTYARCYARASGSRAARTGYPVESASDPQMLECREIPPASGLGQSLNVALSTSYLIVAAERWSVCRAIRDFGRSKNAVGTVGLCTTQELEWPPALTGHESLKGNPRADRAQPVGHQPSSMVVHAGPDRNLAELAHDLDHALAGRLEQDAPELGRGHGRVAGNAAL